MDFIAIVIRYLFPSLAAGNMAVSKKNPWKKLLFNVGRQLSRKQKSFLKDIHCLTWGTANSTANPCFAVFP